MPASPAMATTERRRRRGQRQRRDKHKRGSSRKVARAGDGAAAAAAATTVEDVPDHLLQVILLRLDSSVSLLRAAAACTRWRRVVADAGFLRSFRSLHGARHVVGLYHTVDPCFGSPPPAGGSSVVFVPSSPPPVIGVDSRFFSLDFLPDYHDNDSWSWQLVDSRGGLLLFSKKRKSTSRWAAMAEARCFSFPDLVVCEPLTRRYQGIVSPVYFRRLQCLGVFLLDGDAADADDIGGGIRMSNFRVVAALHGRTWQHDRAVPLACVFTSGSDGGWRVLQSAAAAAVDLPERFDLINFAGRAGGCLYWGIDGEDGAMLVLDEATMRFSIDMFPETIRASYDKWTFRVIDGGGSDDDDGALIRVVRVMRDDLKVFAQIAGSGEWVVERLVSLREATRGLPGHRETYFRQEAKIVAANAAYVLLTPQEKKKWLFSVELETGKVERRHERNRYAGAAYSYELPWPPALQACADYGDGRRRRR